MESEDSSVFDASLDSSPLESKDCQADLTSANAGSSSPEAQLSLPPPPVRKTLTRSQIAHLENSSDKVQFVLFQVLKKIGSLAGGGWLSFRFILFLPARAVSSILLPQKPATGVRKNG